MKSFLSADEDLRERTLGALPGTIARVLYLVSLADREGKLSHAGLERSHGVEVSRAALGDAFRRCSLSLLRSPMEETLIGVQSSGGNAEKLRGLRDFWQRGAEGVTSAQSTHFSYVIGALALVLEERSANQAA